MRIKHLPPRPPREPSPQEIEREAMTERAHRDGIEHMISLGYSPSALNVAGFSPATPPRKVGGKPLTSGDKHVHAVRGQLRDFQQAAAQMIHRQEASAKLASDPKAAAMLFARQNRNVKE